jgi:hypothetical protein
VDPRASLIALAAAAALAAGCGRAAAAGHGTQGATLRVTRDFGASLVTTRRVAAGQSALTALRRSTQVETSYGGRFVESVAGVAGSRSHGRDWIYYVNGIEAGTGAADYELHPGDREWWDLRAWSDLLQTPVVIGDWPEPFVHGFEGRRPRVQVSGLACSAAIASALRGAGARLTRQPSPWSVRVTTLAGAPQALADWRGHGLTVGLTGGRVGVYRPGHGLQPQAGGQALIAGFRPGAATGRSAAVTVAGATPAAACAAARTLAGHPRSVAGTYAVALDGAGHVLAAGGRP